MSIFPYKIEWSDILDAVDFISQHRDMIEKSLPTYGDFNERLITGFHEEYHKFIIEKGYTTRRESITVNILIKWLYGNIRKIHQFVSVEEASEQTTDTTMQEKINKIFNEHEKGNAAKEGGL